VRVKISFNVGTIFCYDCVMALRRFIGSMKGVEGVEIDEGKVSIEYDPSKISEEKIAQIAKDSIEKLGYKILD
jgi:copper chaperone CopZ